MLDDVLRRVLTRVDGARCVVLAGRDGMVVASAARDGGPSPELIAASIVDLFRKAGATFREEGLGTPAELAIGGGDGHVVLREVTPEYLIAAALGSARGLGRARFELRRAAAALEPELV